jgi:hypothetical protein
VISRASLAARSGHDPGLVFGRGHRGGDPVAVVRAVDRQHRQARLGREPPGQGDVALAALMAAAAVPEQHERGLPV